MEREVVERADILITVSEDVKRIFAEKSEQPIAVKTAVIPNGFDEDDFKITDVPEETRKVITYTGTISEAYEVDCLLEALLRMPESWKSRLLIRFVGKVPSQVVQKFRETGIDVELVGYVDHPKSIGYLFRSDLLLLVIPKVKNNRGILTGKFFEYLASQKPVLAIGPVDGDLDRIIQETGCGQLFDYADRDGISQFILKNLENPVSESNAGRVNRYSRRQLTEKIAELLNASIHC